MQNQQDLTFVIHLLNNPLTHSITHSLTHKLTHALTHSLTHIQKIEELIKVDGAIVVGIHEGECRADIIGLSE